MEYSEFPGVENGIERKYKFSQIKWLNKEKFQNLIKEAKSTEQLAIHPRLNDNHDKNKLEFIGKTIPKSPAVLIGAGLGNGDTSSAVNSPYHYLEVAGTVFKSKQRGNIWNLRITHENRVYEIENDFLVLSIEDPNAFFWCSNKEDNVKNTYSFTVNYKEIPRYALRVCVDKVDNRYSYIGRTFMEEDSTESSEPRPKRPKFMANSWCQIDDKIPQIFGKVNKNYKLLFAPFKNLELGFDEFETLCLKASPATLSILCRSAIRSYVNYSQKNIKSINTLERKLLPETLVNFLKYPEHLKTGEFMLQDEKLVQKDDKYELAIEKNTGNLVFRSLNDDNRPKSYVIARNVDSIWLHRFHTVFYNHSNSTTYAAHSLYNTIAAYKFFIEWDGSDRGYPNSQVKQLNDID